jgi:hypothetical protein
VHTCSERMYFAWQKFDSSFPGKLRKNVQLSGKYSFLKKPMYTFGQYLEKQLLI